MGIVRFDFERLEVFQVAVEAVAVIDELAYQADRPRLSRFRRLTSGTGTGTGTGTGGA